MSRGIMYIFCHCFMFHVSCFMFHVSCFMFAFICWPNSTNIVISVNIHVSYKQFDLTWLEQTSCYDAHLKWNILETDVIYYVMLLSSTEFMAVNIRQSYLHFISLQNGGYCFSSQTVVLVIYPFMESWCTVTEIINGIDYRRNWAKVVLKWKQKYFRPF